MVERLTSERLTCRYLAIGTSKYSIFDRNLDAFKGQSFKAILLATPGKFSMCQMHRRYKRFSIEVGMPVTYQYVTLEAYPTFRLENFLILVFSFENSSKDRS